MNCLIVANPTLSERQVKKSCFALSMRYGHPHTYSIIES